MTLTGKDLVIHIGDRVTFYAMTQDNDHEMLEGEVRGVVTGDELTLRVNVNEFLTCTIAASMVTRVNNLFINLNNFSNNINLSVAL